MPKTADRRAVTHTDGLVLFSTSAGKRRGAPPVEFRTLTHRYPGRPPVSLYKRASVGKETVVLLACNRAPLFTRHELLHVLATLCQRAGAETAVDLRGAAETWTGEEAAELFRGLGFKATGSHSATAD